MPVTELAHWLEEFTRDGVIWYVKRLSANDTQSNDSHQGGPYILKEVAFRVSPKINSRAEKNPRSPVSLYIDSHASHREANLIYYNNKHWSDGTNDEVRLTGLGGRASPLLSQENTGALAVFAFPLMPEAPASDCHVWVCEHGTEADLVEDWIGPVEPGKGVVWPPAQLPLLGLVSQTKSSCRLDRRDMPQEWLSEFPSGEAIIAKAIAMRPDRGLPPDQRLLRRRNCEFEIFKSVEEAIELPHVHAGFSDLDEFLARAQTILQRRKSRSGRSLELHTRAIFEEENLRPNIDFSHGSVSEVGKRPDFIFPSVDAYRDPSFPSKKLRMLAVKTTCRDRWRQVLDEAKRIETKHLLTLQEGISEIQFRQMTDAKICLVVPKGLVSKYPKAIRGDLQTLESFIADMRTLRM